MNSKTPCVLDALGSTQIILTLEVAHGSFTFSHLKIKKRGYENISHSHVKRK